MEIVNIKGKKYTSAKEAAEATGLHYNTIVRLCKAGEIPFLKVQSLYIIEMTWVENNKIPEGYETCTEAMRKAKTTRPTVIAAVNDGRLESFKTSRTQRDVLKLFVKTSGELWDKFVEYVANYGSERVDSTKEKKPVEAEDSPVLYTLEQVCRTLNKTPFQIKALKMKGLITPYHVDTVLKYNINELLKV